LKRQQQTFQEEPTMSYRHLTSEERFAIEHFLQQGMSFRKIALSLGRSHTTISREWRRNSSKNGYRYQTAQARSASRQSQPRHYRCQSRPALVAYVDEKLRNEWAPEQIAGRICLDYPDDPLMRISAETIYRWVYTTVRSGGCFHHHLRRGRNRRRPRTNYGQGKRFMLERTRITDRPEIVAGRGRFGDWEADLVSASFGKAALVSCIERKSRYLLLAKVEDKTAISFNTALTGQLLAIPTELRRTLTLDNGSEMAKFKELEAATGMDTYFCEPHSPWQRGANENCNGLVRQYFPRGINFRSVTEKTIQRAATRLNMRPRKCLGYRTPTEIFSQALIGALAI
jgi:transposase, IS30 family